MPRKLLTNIFLLASLAGTARAQSALSTIQDVLFKADGARFSGTLVIHWSTFDVNNLGTVVQQSRTVSVVNGNLQIQLAANSTAQPPANLYTVDYQSDGREQFTELWAVPVASQPLTVPQVRVGTVTSGTGSGGSGGGGGAGSSTPILESTVVGLLADLGQRPTRGPGYGTNAVAVINANGQVETAVGVLGDCVFVDGTTGPCGGPMPTFVDAEVPGGTIDGTNSVFTLQNPPSGSSLMLYRNGVYLTAGSDYALSGSAITFVAGAQPVAQDVLSATYRVDPLGNIGQLRQTPGANVALAQVICSAAGSSTSATALASLGRCDIPATSLHTGDRLEVRFTYGKTGTATAWDVSLEWGSANMLTRHASAADVGLTGKTEAAITATGAQISVQSWGTVLSFQAGITAAPAQIGLRIDFRGKLAVAGPGTVTLSNFTVLRYPGN